MTEITSCETQDAEIYHYDYDAYKARSGYNFVLYLFDRFWRSIDVCVHLNAKEIACITAALEFFARALSDLPELIHDADHAFGKVQLSREDLIDLTRTLEGGSETFTLSKWQIEQIYQAVKVAGRYVRNETSRPSIDVRNGFNAITDEERQRLGRHLGSERPWFIEPLTDAFLVLTGQSGSDGQLFH